MKTTFRSFVKQQTKHVVAVFFAVFFIFCSAHLQAQPLFEESIAPSMTIPEDAWDGKQIPTTSNFVMLSNTIQYGHNLIGLTILNSSGGIVQRTVVWDFSNTSASLFGTSIDVDLTATGSPAGFFITGARVVNGQSQMFVTRTDMAGMPTWTQSLPIANTTGTIQFRDGGISIERQPNGDVVAIGRSTDLTSNLGQMIAARFTAAGALVWSNRYRSGNVVGSIIPAESCNGNAGNPLVQVVAVAGAFVNAAGVRRTFGSCIDAATGVELWRTYYSSGLTSDEGLDIVQKGTSGVFMMVGRATNGASPATLWILNLTANTGALPAGASAYYTSNGELIGRDVCLSTTGSRAVIAGTYNRPAAGAFVNNAFLMQISFNNCAVPNWTKVYTASSPNPIGTENVTPVIAGSSSVAGYFLTTDGNPQTWGGGNPGAHPIYVNTAGNHPYGGDCPILTLPVTPTCVGTRTNLQKVKTAYPWTPVTLNWEILVNVRAACDGVPPAPLTSPDERSEGAAIVEIAPGVTVSPNPAFVGENLQVVLDGYADNIVLSLFDMTGRKLIENNLGFDPEGESLTYTLPTEKLAGGTYILQVRSGQKINTVKIMIK